MHDCVFGKIDAGSTAVSARYMILQHAKPRLKHDTSVMKGQKPERGSQQYNRSSSTCVPEGRHQSFRGGASKIKYFIMRRRKRKHKKT